MIPSGRRTTTTLRGTTTTTLPICSCSYVAFTQIQIVTMLTMISRVVLKLLVQQVDVRSIINKPILPPSNAPSRDIPPKSKR